MSVVEYGSMSLQDAYGLAVERHRAGKFEEAIQVLRQILSAEPNHRLAASMLGAICCAQRRFQDAVEILQPLIDVEQTDYSAQINLGYAYLGIEDHENAATCFETACRLRPTDPSGIAGLGNAFLLCGQPSEAERFYRKAISLDETQYENHIALAALLDSLDRQAEARAIYGQAIEMEPADGSLRVRMAVNLFELNELDLARKECMTALGLLGSCAATELLLARMLIKSAEYEAVTSICDRLIDRISPNTLALAYKMIAASQTGDSENFEILANPALLVERHITAVEGYADLRAFNTALTEHIESHPALFEFETYEITHFGREVKNILHPAARPIDAWCRIVTDEIENYISVLLENPKHPFIAAMPANWQLNAWANVLGAEGYQSPHIHENAWLSGVYYVRVPGGGTSEIHAGEIAFGPPGDELDLKTHIPCDWHSPEPGLLILFPSYWFHHTKPTADVSARIAIAFDVVPASPRDDK